MKVKLTYISGLNNTSAKNLHAKAAIYDSLQLADATDTPAKRASLAEKTGIAPVVLYSLAKQADLLRCETIDTSEAEKLVRAGVRCVADLTTVNLDRLLEFLKNGVIFPDVNEYQAVEWIASAMGTTSTFEPDPSDTGNPEIFPVRKKASLVHSSAYGSDLSDIITELGVGIAQAQRQLDLASLEIQKEILADAEMAALGFNATWYAIPEASFTLKMEYTYSETGEKKINVVPMNASYNNIFNTTRAEESTLSLRFVPIPAPDSVTQRVNMPDLVGLTLEDAKQLLDELGLTGAEFIYNKVTKTKNGAQTEITGQTVKVGTPIPPRQSFKVLYNSTIPAVPRVTEGTAAGGSSPA